MSVGNNRGYSPAQQCYGWTCPNGHHSISAVGPVYSCARCPEKRPDKTRYIPYQERKERARRRHLAAALSDAVPNLPNRADREAVAA